MPASTAHIARARAVALEADDAAQADAARADAAHADAAEADAAEDVGRRSGRELDAFVKTREARIFEQEARVAAGVAVGRLGVHIIILEMQKKRGGGGGTRRQQKLSMVAC